MTVPSTLPTTDIIKVNITDYEVLSEEVEASFHVVGEESDQIITYLFIILGVVILVAVLVVIKFS